MKGREERASTVQKGRRDKAAPGLRARRMLRGVALCAIAFYEPGERVKATVGSGKLGQRPFSDAPLYYTRGFFFLSMIARCDKKVDKDKSSSRMATGI